MRVEQVDQVTQRDRATANVQKVHCAIVGSCSTSGRGPAQNMFTSRSRHFSKGWVTFGEYLTGKGTSPTNQCWCQKTRMIVVSCSIKISAVHHLVLSQYTRLADGQTDRRTGRRTELHQQYRALHYMQLHGKNHVIVG